jgi:signal transduction histidine kinase
MLELVAIAAMAAVVVVLGVLQYRWMNEIGGADRERLQTALAAGIRNFNQQFAFDFERLGEGFEIDPEAPASTIRTRIVHLYSNWTQSTSRPELVAGLYLWISDHGGVPHLESLDRERKQLQNDAWPSSLEPLHAYLEKTLNQLPASMSGHDATYYPWTFCGDVPALIRPLFKMSSEEADSDMKVRPVGFLIIQLDAGFLKDRYLPELVDHYFGPSGFRVAVRDAGPPFQTFYVSDSTLAISGSSPDAGLNLFDSVEKEARRRGHATIEPDDASRQWQLVAQYPSGSLEATVARWRFHNLAISIGLLVILAGTAALVFSAARRAEKLAKFQMEFVAGVSHELCTPLAAVNSAVENLADGVLDHPAQIKEYASIIRDHGGRLERLMDEILQLASGKFDQIQTELQSVEIAGIIAQSIAASEPALREAGFTVETKIHPDLPPLMADPITVRGCVENLIGNAMKYGGTARWIAVQARAVQVRGQDEVQISVKDKGIGIAPSDLANIFEPFYRAQPARTGQPRGVGLGLYLVKRMMEGLGGRASVTSQIGRGSCFTLHFPVQGSSEFSRTQGWLRRSFELFSASITKFSSGHH